MSLLDFAKYQASGNDFILVADLDDVGALDPGSVRAICDRWTGVGADGVIRVSRERDAEADATWAFHLANADGSPAEMSGNGMRCLGAYLHDRGLETADAFDVRTPAGRRRVEVRVEAGRAVAATVAMGEPGFARSRIPMRGPAWETFLDEPFDLGDGRAVRAGAVSMGNPHLVLFLPEDPERYHVEHIGPALERHEWFPERTNVEFARVAEDGIDVRVWERGVGETLACGTGACAVAVLAQETGRAPARVTIRFRGGPLEVERRPDGAVLLGGPVAHVFDGTVDPAVL